MDFEEDWTITLEGPRQGNGFGKEKRPKSVFF